MDRIRHLHPNMVLTLSTNKEQGSGSASSTHVDSLPDDLLFEILARLSAEDIMEKARFMCRRWNRLIHGNGFIDAHLHHSTYGLLLSRWGSEQFFVTAARGRIEISKLSYYVRYPTAASCNGLVSAVREISPSNITPFILNPTTKYTLDLPPLLCRGDLIYDCFSIAYVAPSMEYKVVGIYVPDRKNMLASCGILTVGVDKSWRHVVVDKLSFQVNKLLLVYPLLTEGFLHWASPGGEWNVVLSLNVETEVMTETPLPLPLLHPHPQDYRFLGYDYYYMTTGRHRSMFGDSS